MIKWFTLVVPSATMKCVLSGFRKGEAVALARSIQLGDKDDPHLPDPELSSVGR